MLCEKNIVKLKKIKSFVFILFEIIAAFKKKSLKILDLDIEYCIADLTQIMFTKSGLCFSKLLT